MKSPKKLYKGTLKKILPLIFIVLFLIIGYFIVVAGYPKNSSRYPFFVIFFLADFYLWVSIRKQVKNLKSLTRYFITIFYWLPLAVFIIYSILSIFVSLREWDPALMTYALGLVLVFYGSKLLTVVFFLLADLIKILHFTLKFARAKKRGIPFKPETGKMNRAKFLKTVGLASGGVLFSGLIIGIVKWAYDFKIRKEVIRIPALPAAFEGLNIVQVSDMHLGSWVSSEPLQEAVDLINSLDADIILFTGDLVNFTTSEAFKFRDILLKMKAKYGIYATLGNHDYGDYLNWPSAEAKEQNMKALYKFYKELGWTLLNNENRILKSGDDKLAIVGVENWSSNPRFPRRGNLKKALIGTEDATVKLLMSHDPTHWEKEVSLDYPEIDLTFSGHTHGFQFGVQLKNFRWSPAQYVFKYWAGLYSQELPSKPQYLYVNRGLGMIGYPGRIGILPEITQVTLES